MSVLRVKNGKIRLFRGRIGSSDGETIATQPDTSPPTIPSNVIISSISSEAVNSSWDASTDNIGVSGYEYRLNTGVGINVGNNTSRALNGLVSNTSYSFEVRAYDAAGNYSNWSTAENFVTVSTGSATTFSVLMLYGDVSRQGFIPSSGDSTYPTPYHQMRFRDTGNDGFSGLKDYLEATPDASGNWYSCSESYDQDFDPSTDLTGIDILFLASSQRAWSSSEEAAIVAAVSGGMGLMGFSDSALGGEYWRVGAQNTVGQSARNPLFENFGMQVYVDQASGIKTINLNASQSLAQGTTRQFRGEGVSPWRLDTAASGNWAKGSPRSIAGFGETPGKNQNITYTGPICALAASYYGDGVVIGLFDRNGLWNNGAGSNLYEVDNAFVYRALFEHMAGTIPKPNDVLEK